MGIVFFALVSSGASSAAPSRFNLIDQSDYVGNKGFYIDLENDTGSSKSSSLTNLKLFAGVADGKKWIFIPSKLPFQTGHEYDVVLVIDSGMASVSIDGAIQGSQIAAISPANSSLTADNIPGWANAPTDYFVTESVVQIKQLGQTEFNWTSPNAIGSQFNPTSPKLSLIYSYRGGDVIIEVRFKILATPPSTTGLVDRYGQPSYADYPGKIHSDIDLAKDRTAEQKQNKLWSQSTRFDQYGGLNNTPWHDTASRFYRIIKRHGFSWLIDPLGKPCFYTGVDTASIPYWEATPITGREDLFNELPKSDASNSDLFTVDNWGTEPGITYFRFTDSNLIRKYGKTSWQSDALSIRSERLKSWGLSGLGKWCEVSSTVPNIPVLEWNGVPNLVRRPDFFDPAIESQMVNSLRQQIVPYMTDPYVVGWSLGNEYDEIITTDEITKILALPDSNPSREVLMKYAQTWTTPMSTPPSVDDLERLRQFYADSYYSFVEKSIKGIDRNHLFFGFWLAVGWWQNPSDWVLEQKHVDAMGIDIYTQTIENAQAKSLIAKLTVPIIIGEFGFPPDYSSSRSFGTYGDAVRTESQTGELYKQWIHDTATNPFVIGTCWFQMYDEPITGRGPGHGSDLVYGENYAFGFVSDTDTPKWDMLGDVREGNLNADKWRMAANEADAAK